MADPSVAERGGSYVDRRLVHVPCSPDCAFEPIRKIGGANGWYYADWLWHARGALDLLVGGNGLQPQRPNGEHLSAGDTIDCWRVEAVEPNRLLRLFCTLKLPGRAWLQFEVERNQDGSAVRQTALFEPRGLLGHLYWYASWPFHQFIFSGMLRAIARRCNAKS